MKLQKFSKIGILRSIKNNLLLYFMNFKNLHFENLKLRSQRLGDFA